MSPGTHPPPIVTDPNRGFLRWALHLFYDSVWWLAMVGASPWWGWRMLTDARFARMVRGRLARDLPDLAASESRPRILIHGVSVGEVKAAQSLVESIERELPELDVVISTTTYTGIDVARDLFEDRTVVRFPIDPSFFVRRFLTRLAPVCVVLVELEIWPNFLRVANELGIPVAVVNGRITEESFSSYRHFRNLLPQFNRISLFCVQDEEYARRFAELGNGCERVVVTGNVKADSLGDGPVEPGEELSRLLAGGEGQVIVTAGSTHDPEERWLAEAWREAIPETRLILVPRHPDRAEAVVGELAQLGLQAQRLSGLRTGERPDPSRPVIVDTIGELERVYGLSDLVYIGGSLVPHGGQNMLEPASQGRGVLYGPHVENFQLEAALLEEAGAAVRLEGRDELAPTLLALVRDEERRVRMAEAGLRAVRAQKGATRRTLEALIERCLTLPGR